MRSPDELAAIKLESFRMRQNGCSFEEIALALGISKSAATKYVREKLDEINQDLGMTAKQEMDLDLSRADRLLLNLQDDIEIGNTRAVDAAIKVLNYRAKMLGLYAEERADVDAKEKSISKALADDISEMSDEDLLKILNNELNSGS